MGHAAPALLLGVTALKLLLKAQLGLALWRLRALGRPAALDADRTPPPPTATFLFYVSAIALWAAIASSDASLLPRSLSLYDVLGPTSPLWPNGTPFFNGTIASSEEALSAADAAAAAAAASGRASWASAFVEFGLPPPMPPSDLLNLNNYGTAYSGYNGYSGYASTSAPHQDWLGEWVSSDGAVPTLSAAPVATLAVAGCTLALGVGDGVFGGAVATSALLLAFFSASALRLGPLDVSQADLATMQRGHLPPRWADLPLSSLLSAALLSLQLPLLLAAAAAALWALHARPLPLSLSSEAAHTSHTPHANGRERGLGGYQGYGGEGCSGGGGGGGQQSEGGDKVRWLDSQDEDHAPGTPVRYSRGPFTPIGREPHFGGQRFESCSPNGLGNGRFDSCSANGLGNGGSGSSHGSAGANTGGGSRLAEAAATDPRLAGLAGCCGSVGCSSSSGLALYLEGGQVLDLVLGTHIYIYIYIYTYIYKYQIVQ